MSNYSDYDTPDPCPYCGTECHADFVDVGVGMTQCGPYHCDNCLASQIGVHDYPRPITDREKETGWYAPGAPLSDKANTVGGKIVDHKVAKLYYDAGMLDEKPQQPGKRKARATCEQCFGFFYPQHMIDNCPTCKSLHSDTKNCFDKEITIDYIQIQSKTNTLEYEKLEYTSTESVVKEANENAKHVLASLYTGMDLASWSALLTLFRKFDQGELNLEGISTFWIRRSQR